MVKKCISILCTIAIVLGLAGCGNKLASSETGESTLMSSTSSVSASAVSAASEEDDDYEDSLFRILDDDMLEPYQGKIQDVFYTGADWVILEQNGDLLCRDGIKDEVVTLETGTDGKQFVCEENDGTVAILNQDGTYDIWYILSSGGSRKLASHISLDDFVQLMTVYEIIAGKEETKRVMQTVIQDGKLIYNIYNSDGSLYDSMEGKLTFRDGGGGEPYEGVVRDYYHGGWIVLEDNSLHFVVPDTSAGSRSSFWKTPEYTNVEKIFAEGSNASHFLPLFSVQGDDTALYTDDGLYRDSDNKEEHIIKVSMPEGYTTDDIKKIWIANNMLLEFTDGSIYYVEFDKSSQAELQQELTQLNQEGKVRSIYVNYGDSFYAVMDDGRIYTMRDY